MEALLKVRSAANNLQYFTFQRNGLYLSVKYARIVMNIHHITGNNYIKLSEKKEQFATGRKWDEKQV